MQRRRGIQVGQVEWAMQTYVTKHQASESLLQYILRNGYFQLDPRDPDVAQLSLMSVEQL